MKEWRQPWDLNAVDELLAIRLGKANARRRQQLMYEKRHAKKLGYFSTLVPMDEDPIVQETPLARPEILIKDAQDLAPANLTTGTSIDLPEAKETVYSKTTATEYVARPEKIPRRSIISISTTFSGYIGHDVTVPLPPTHTVKKAFECPYCYMILPANKKDYAAWR